MSPLSDTWKYDVAIIPGVEYTDAYLASLPASTLAALHTQAVAEYDPVRQTTTFRYAPVVTTTTTQTNTNYFYPPPQPHLFRVKYTDVSSAVLSNIFKRPMTAWDWQVSNNLPKDARIVRVNTISPFYDRGAPEVGNFRVIWESSEWDEIPEGSIPPEFDLQFKFEAIDPDQFLHLFGREPRPKYRSRKA